MEFHLCLGFITMSWPSSRPPLGTRRLPTKPEDVLVQARKWREKPRVAKVARQLLRKHVGKPKMVTSKANMMAQQSRCHWTRLDITVKLTLPVAFRRFSRPLSAATWRPAKSGSSLKPPAGSTQRATAKVHRWNASLCRWCFEKRWWKHNWYQLIITASISVMFGIVWPCCFDVFIGVNQLIWDILRSLAPSYMAWDQRLFRRWLSLVIPVRLFSTICFDLFWSFLFVFGRIIQW